MKIEDLRNVSESTRQRNPALFGVGGLRSPVSQPDKGQALVKKPKRKARGRKSVEGRPVLRITLIACRHTTLDADNSIGGFKQMRDVIADSFQLDDAESTIDWQYSQVKTNGQQGVIVMIERV